MARSAVNALESAVVSALKLNATLVGLVGASGFYNGSAPTTAAYPHIVLGDASEVDLKWFQTKIGKRVVLTGHIWTLTYGGVVGKSQAMSIYEQLETTLNGTTLVVTSQTMLRGSCNLVSVVPDPNGKLMHGVFRYEAEVLNA
jgi:hypothetical protein